MQNNNAVRTMLKEAGILFGITLIAGLLLGVVNELTKDPIRRQQEKASREACETVFASSDGRQFAFTPVDYTLDETLTAELAEDGVEIGTVYQVTDANGGTENPEGYVAEVVSKEGYGGDIVLYVGVDSEKTVKGVSILELSETAGLGMEAPKVLVPQFAGRNVESFVYTKTGATAPNEVDAITSATVTTSAVVSGVNGGIRAIRYLLEHPEQAHQRTGGAVNE